MNEFADQAEAIFNSQPRILDESGHYLVSEQYVDSFQCSDCDTRVEIDLIIKRNITQISFGCNNCGVMNYRVVKN
jgi:predicted RNA-binding Zn-ribbon protein involved in translation (DUF1610 family)